MIGAGLQGGDAIAAMLLFLGPSFLLFHNLPHYASDLGLDITPPTEPQSTLPVAVGGTATISSSFLSSDDPDNPASQLIYQIVTAPAHGSLLLNGSATTSFTQADIDNGLVEYHERGDRVTSDTFRFTVSDPAGNVIGPEPFEIAIVSTTAPVIYADNTLVSPVGAKTMIGKDTLCTVALGNDPSAMTYHVVAGPTHGTLYANGSPATAFTQADIDNGRVGYIGDARGGDSFTFQVSDSAGNRTAITSLSIVTPPALASERTSGASASLRGSDAPAPDVTYVPAPLVIVAERYQPFDFDSINFDQGWSATLHSPRRPVWG